MSTHLVVPDTQCKPGAPTDHLRWLGAYILDRKPDVVVHLGDHWDMPSLSSYDRGKKASEGRRFSDDVDAGNAAWKLIDAPTEKANWSRRKRGTDEYTPRKVRLIGNHENRITRAVEDDARFEGAVGLDQLQSPGWEVHDFLQPVFIDGVAYCHYFYNPMSGRPYGGQNVETRLKTIGHSFTMGHQQGLWYGLRSTIGGIQHGLVAGQFYLHDEEYLGPQGNSGWRGIIVKHQVGEGAYDPMFVSIQYLCQRYEQAPLREFLNDTYPEMTGSLWA
jgi:hypothetical protein